MALDELAISVPLLGMNQKAPKSSGPLGRLEVVTNGQVKKTQQGQLRVQKRDGMSSQSLTVRNVQTGGVLSSGGIPNPVLAHDVGESVLEVGTDSIPYVLGSAGSESWPNTVLTNTMRRTPVYSTQTQSSLPDTAIIGQVAAYSVVHPSGATNISQIMFKDLASGAILAGPFGTSGFGTNPRAKVVSNGTYFWHFFDNANGTAASIGVNVYDTNGVIVGGAIVDTLTSAGDFWDVVYDATVGLCLARPKTSVGGVRFSTLTIAGSTVTTVGHDVASLGPPGGIGFLRPAGDGFVYLAVTSFSGVTVGQVARINSAGTIDKTYNVWLSAADATANGWCNMTGYVIPGGSHDIYVVVSQLATTNVAGPADAPDKVVTYAYRSNYADVVFGTLVATQRSMGLASRLFVAAIPPPAPSISFGGRPVVVLYYPSVQSTATNQFSQTTFFLWDFTRQVASQYYPQIVGRFEYGQAACDWPWTGWDGTQAHPLPQWFNLASAAAESTGDFHVALGFRSTSFTVLQTGSTASGPSTGTGAVGVVDRPVYVFTGAIGIVDEKFSTAGTAISYAGETLLPGPLPITFGGTELAEVNFLLAPEAPTLSSSNGAGDLTPLATYQYVGVWESTTPSGLRIRSAPCTPTSITLGASDDTVQLIFKTLRAGMRAPSAILSLYRTAIIDGVMSTNHYKVSNDLTPSFPNSIAVDTMTITDLVSDAAAAVGEQLYTDGIIPPFSYRYPPPPFNCGTVIGNIVVLAGYDNALWASYEKVEGEALSFAATRRMPMPTDDPIQRVCTMDQRVIVYCKRSQWYIDNVWPDAAGNGQLQTPIELPFTNGCTGAALTTQDGVVYSSDQGGFWITTRDLQNHYIGGPVEDDTSTLGAPFAGVIDDQQRAHFLMSGGLDLVYDGIVDTWYRFQCPTNSVMMATKAGKAAYMDSARTWVTIPGQSTDDSTAIITTVQLAPMAFGSVPGLQMVWDLQFLGTREGRHTLTITLLYDDETTGTDVTVFDSNALAIDFAGGQAYRWDIQPRNPECQAVGVKIVDSFPNGATLGFTLENIGAACGIVPGTRKIAIGQRPYPG